MTLQLMKMDYQKSVNQIGKKTVKSKIRHQENQWHKASPENYQNFEK